MKRIILLLCAAMLAYSGLALADAKVHNKDDQTHQLKITCSSGGGSSTRSISSGTITGIGTGPCKVSVDGGGEVTVADGDTYVIPKN